MKALKSKLAPLIEEYTAFRKSLGYSNTHRHYLGFFDNYCVNHYPQEDKLTEDLVLGWISDEAIHRPGILRDEVFSVRGFAKYLRNGSYIISPEYTPRHKRPPIPYILTEKELANFFAAVDTITWKDPFMHKTIPTLLRLLYTCGLRPNEARFLEQKSVNLDAGEIFIEKTKRQIQRIVQMSDDTIRMMRGYDRDRRIFVGKCDYFFVRSDGRQLTQAVLWQAVHRSWVHANPDISKEELPQINPYTFRHQFASTVMMKWLDEGKDLYSMLPYLKAFMGHVCYSSTVYYIHLLPERLANSPGVDWAKLDSIGLEANIWHS